MNLSIVITSAQITSILIASTRLASIRIASMLFERPPDGRGLMLYCVVGICGGIFLFVKGFRLLQRRRLILDTPFSKIRSASMGMVEISGQAVGPYTMVAPITGRACYYYRTLVWEWRQEGKNKQWVKIAGESMLVPFFVDDNTGRVLVDPRGADLDLHRDFEQEFCDSFFTIKNPAPPNVHSFLSRHGIFTSNKIKVEECCIKPKNSLFILGTLGDNPGIEVGPQPIEDVESLDSFSKPRLSLSLNTFGLSLSGAREMLQTSFLAPRLASPSMARNMAGDISRSISRNHEVIRLSPPSGPAKGADMTQQQKVAAALLKAGVASPTAWAAAGVSAAGGVQVLPDPAAPGSDGASAGAAAAAQTSTFDLRPPVALMQGTNNKTFLISWRSQQEVARSLGWKCTLMIWGGPILALLSLYFLVGINNLF